jgi:hypothetical protein
MPAVEANRAAKVQRLAALLTRWAIDYQAALTMTEYQWTELARADLAMRHARQIWETNVRPPSPETQRLTLATLEEQERLARRVQDLAEQMTHQEFARRLQELAERVRKDQAAKPQRKSTKSTKKGKR